ncbi:MULTISPECIES: hypothetical protein [Methylobacter]
MAISPLPPLDRTSPTFRDDADDFFANRLPAFSIEANAAAVAIGLNSINDVSTTSVVIGSGSKTFTVSTAKSFLKGMYLVIADDAAPTANSMYCQIASYNAGTGVLVVNVLSFRGSGTKAAWDISPAPSGGGAALGANADITSLSLLANINGGQIGGYRNRIINGAMKIDQFKQGGANASPIGVLAYNIDQFYSWSAGATPTVQQVSIASLNRLRFTGITSNTGIWFGQRIEAANCMDLASQNATLQVKLSSTSLTSITWTAYYAATADTFGTVASPTKTQIATGSFTINTVEALYSATMAIPAAATTGIEIVFSGGALLASQTITVGDMQFEIGSVATAFEIRDRVSELCLCQRYLPVFRNVSITEVFANGYSTSTTAARFLINFHVPTRIAPTSVTNGSAIFFSTSGAMGVAACTSVGIGTGTSNRAGEIVITVASGLTTGYGGGLQSPATANNFFMFLGAQL